MVVRSKDYGLSEAIQYVIVALNLNPKGILQRPTQNVEAMIIMMKYGCMGPIGWQYRSNII